MSQSSKSMALKYYYFIVCILLLIGIVPAFKVLLPNGIADIIYKLLPYLVCLLFFRNIIKVNNFCKYYIIIMIIGSLLHVGLNLQTPILFDFLRWTMPIILLAICQKYDNCNKLFTIIIIGFFISECVVAIYERFTSTFLIEYVASDFYNQEYELNRDFSNFRSASLLRHPLNNANFISLFLGFMLCSKSFKNIWKVILLCLGLIGLWCENSRGAMLCWLFLIAYRFLFYNTSIKRMIVLCIVLVLAIDPIMNALCTTDIMGRLNFDFSDDSTLTRLLSYTFFGNEKWDFYKIVAGGSILCMPGTNLTLENGLLVTLGYWGWGIGSLKVILEFVLTYVCLYKYEAREKFIILVSFWGVAFMNNNSFYPLMISLFVITYVAFNISVNEKKYNSYEDSF